MDLQKLTLALFVLTASLGCGPRPEPATESIAPSPTDAAELLIPADARQVPIHWRLKLPSLKPGEYVLRSAEEFQALLARHSDEKQTRNFIKWNNLDFGKRMALIAAESHMSLGYDHRICKVWQTNRELIVEIEAFHPEPGAPVATLCCCPTDGVAVKRCELPVRFVWRRRTWSKS